MNDNFSSGSSYFVGGSSGVGSFEFAASSSGASSGGSYTVSSGSNAASSESVYLNGAGNSGTGYSSVLVNSANGGSVLGGARGAGVVGGQALIRRCEVDSEVGKRVMDATTPIKTSETQTMSVRDKLNNEYKGIFLNKAEIEAWRGELALDRYEFNLERSNFDHINKQNQAEYKQYRDVQIHYLRPKRPPPPGPIYIIQQADRQVAPAPPLVLRVEKPGQKGQDEVVYEQPPTPPPTIKPKVILIGGKPIPPPKRRLIVELVPQPDELGKLEIYRWLQYEQQKRQVVFHKEKDDTPVCPDPRNLIIEWSKPRVVEELKVRYDTVAQETDVEEWVRMQQAAGHRLVPTAQLEQRIKDFNGSQFEAELVANKPYVQTSLELVGEFNKFTLVDLMAAWNTDIREYRQWLEERRIRYDGVSINVNPEYWLPRFHSAIESFYSRSSRYPNGSELDDLMKQLGLFDSSSAHFSSSSSGQSGLSGSQSGLFGAQSGGSQLARGPQASSSSFREVQMSASSEYLSYSSYRL